MTDDPTTKHETSVEPADVFGHPAAAMCECGWWEPARSVGEAEYAARKHREAVDE